MLPAVGCRYSCLALLKLATGEENLSGKTWRLTLDTPSWCMCREAPPLSWGLCLALCHQRLWLALASYSSYQSL